jgi:hypothetical protein
MAGHQGRRSRQAGERIDAFGGRPSWLLATFALLVGLAACARQLPEPSHTLDGATLQPMVVGNTLLIADDQQTEPLRLYLDPHGGGWMDQVLLTGKPRTELDMLMVIAWMIAPNGDICTWTAPSIGDMVANMPPRYLCLHIDQLNAPPPRNVAVFTQASQSQRRPMEIGTGNLFRAAEIEQFRMQVRALYGGHIPIWVRPTIPSAT